MAQPTPEGSQRLAGGRAQLYHRFGVPEAMTRIRWTTSFDRHNRDIVDCWSAPIVLGLPTPSTVPRVGVPVFCPGGSCVVTFSGTAVNTPRLKPGACSWAASEAEPLLTEGG